MEISDLLDVRRIQRALDMIGVTVQVMSMHPPCLHAYVYRWRVFLRHLGYDPDGEDAVLARHVNTNHGVLQFVIRPGDKIKADITLDLPECGKEYFLSRWGTGDGFRDEMLFAVLSKYSAEEIKQRAIEKVSQYVNSASF